MRFLRVNMSTGKITMQEVPERYRLFGNRGLVANLSCDEIDPQCHALGAGNKLIIATSPLDGLGVSSTGRLSVGGKSPLTGGIKEANAGGVAATKLVRHGIKAIIVEGMPQTAELSVLHIGNGRAELRPAASLMGKGTYEVADLVYKEFGKNVGLITIGPAGEYRLGSAGVFVNGTNGDPSRAAARGGMGAVMAAKGLKAVVIEGDGNFKPPVQDMKAFREARKSFTQAILEEPTIKVYKEYGTMGVLMTLNGLSAMPTFGYRKGTWDLAEQISGDQLHDLILSRGGEGSITHKCMDVCIIQCSNVVPDQNGKRVVAPLEYECTALLGANLGIADLDEIASITRLCNDIGVDGIEMGAALGVAADAGVLKFGEPERVRELIRQVGAGTVLGRVLGSGANVTGRTFGMVRVPVVKGQAMAGHEPRGLKGMSVTYAKSTMGADHTAAPTFRAQMDHRKPEGQMKISRDIQVIMAFYDNFCCMFVSRALTGKLNIMMDMINAIYGTNLGADYATRLGKEIIKLERAFNTSAGVTEEYVPEFMRSEGIEPYGILSDIPQGDYDRFWEESFWGKPIDLKRSALNR